MRLRQLFVFKQVKEAGHRAAARNTSLAD
jgi:hypothetical protein